MGNDNSTPLPPPPSDDLRFFTITFSGAEMSVRDSLYLNYCRESEVQLMLDATKEAWPPGVKFHTTMVQYGYRIKLNGRPFEQVEIGFKSESVWSRNFLATMFLKLGKRGWVPYVNSDLRRFGDTCTVFMHYRAEAVKDFVDSPSIAVVGLHNSDELQLINIDGGLAQLLFDVVTEAWHKNVSMKEKTTDVKNGFEALRYYEIHMDGSPWGYTTNESEAVHGRLVVLRVIEAMAKQGWRMVLNCNIRPMTDSLFFIRDDKIAGQISLGGPSMFGMGLHKMDELRIVGRTQFDATWQPQVVEAIGRQIQAFWPSGLKRSEQKEDFYVLEMHGTPWWADGTQAVQARLLMAKVLEALLSLGWMVKSTVDCSKKDNDKNSFFFERCNPIETSVAVVSFNESDKIRSINCPREVEDILDSTINRLWEVQRKRPYGASNEWKLKGCPWDWGHWQNKALALHLVHALSTIGFSIMASADTSAKYVHQENGPDYPLDVHSWFLIRTEALEKSNLKYGVHPEPVAFVDQLGVPPPYSYLAPSPNVTPRASRPGTPDEDPLQPPPYEAQGVAQWGNSLYPRL